LENDRNMKTESEKIWEEILREDDDKLDTRGFALVGSSAIVMSSGSISIGI